MKNKKYLCLLSLCLCLSCSPSILEAKGLKDELGVSYEEGDLQKDNVFDYYYTNQNPWKDDGWHDNVDFIEIDTKFPDNCVADRNELVEVPLYIRWNPSRFSSAYSDELHPFLSFEAVCSSIDYYYGEVTTYYSSSGNFQEISKYEEKAYGYSRLDFPSKNTYYIGYRYEANLSIDFSRFFSEDTQKGTFYFTIGVRRMDKECNQFVENKRDSTGKSMCVTYPGLFWSNTIQFTVSYLTKSENQKKVDVSLVKRKVYDR